MKQRSIRLLIAAAFSALESVTYASSYFGSGVKTDSTSATSVVGGNASRVTQIVSRTNTETSVKSDVKAAPLVKKSSTINLASDVSITSLNNTVYGSNGGQTLEQQLKAYADTVSGTAQTNATNSATTYANSILTQANNTAKSLSDTAKNQAISTCIC
jgi:hypothetical protein